MKQIKEFSTCVHSSNVLKGPAVLFHVQVKLSPQFYFNFLCRERWKTGSRWYTSARILAPSAKSSGEAARREIDFLNLRAGTGSPHIHLGYE